MSVLTSVFGMAPLILFPGAGSELYRGIGSVVVGGLLISTVFTLVLVPALFSLFIDARSGLARLIGRLIGHGRVAEPRSGD
jgi:HAE1 family hydrophobic/amphiphilic exporter-1